MTNFSNLIDRLNNVQASLNFGLLGKVVDTVKDIATGKGKNDDDKDEDEDKDDDK